MKYVWIISELVGFVDVGLIILESLIEKIDRDGAFDVMQELNWNCIVESIDIVHPLTTVPEIVKDVSAAPTAFEN